jgi:hypothetical protein
MNKTKTIFVTSILLVLIIGCKTKEVRPIWWDGQSITAENFQGKVLAAMLWIRPMMNRELEALPGNCQVYKRFEENDYKLFREYIHNPEKPSFIRGVPWNQYLYLSFLDGSSYLIGFQIDHETVILPNGYSEKLYTLLTEEEICPTYDVQNDSIIGPKAPIMGMEIE